MCVCGCLLYETCCGEAVMFAGVIISVCYGLFVRPTDVGWSAEFKAVSGSALASVSSRFEFDPTGNVSNHTDVEFMVENTEVIALSVSDAGVRFADVIGSGAARWSYCRGRLVPDKMNRQCYVGDTVLEGLDCSSGGGGLCIGSDGYALDLLGRRHQAPVGPILNQYGRIICVASPGHTDPVGESGQIVVSLRACPDLGVDVIEGIARVYPSTSSVGTACSALFCAAIIAVLLVVTAPYQYPCACGKTFSSSGERDAHGVERGHAVGGQGAWVRRMYQEGEVAPADIARSLRLTVGISAAAAFAGVGGEAVLVAEHTMSSATKWWSASMILGVTICATIATACILDDRVRAWRDWLWSRWPSRGSLTGVNVAVWGVVGWWQAVPLGIYFWSPSRVVPLDWKKASSLIAYLDCELLLLISLAYSIPRGYGENLTTAILFLMGVASSALLGRAIVEVNDCVSGRWVRAFSAAALVITTNLIVAIMLYPMLGTTPGVTNATAWCVAVSVCVSITTVTAVRADLTN